MTPIVAFAAFTLITVTNQGEVFHAKGFDTLRMCEQAKSVAVYGRTIEQVEADRKVEQEREAKLEAEWRAKHPPRKATAEESSSGTWGCSNSYCYHVKDGWIYEDRFRLTVSNSLLTTISPTQAIKHAECVIEPKKGD